MPARTHAFTNATLKAIRPPKKGRKHYHDPKTRGLVLQVTKRGSKVFYLVRKVQGRTERIRIGPFPDLSVEQARQAAMRLHVEQAFTKASLKAIQPPGKGRKDYHDPKTRGLVLHVTNRGSKVFYLVRKVQRRTERIRIGPFPDLTVDQARGSAAHLNSEIAQGRNPAQAKRAIRAETTLQQLFDTFLTRHAKPYKKASSVTTDEWLFGHYLACWGARQLSTVRVSDVQTLHGKIGADHGHYAANAAMRLLRTLFSKARAWGWAGDNPVRGIEWFHEKSRERFLGADELPRFFGALAKEPNTTFRDFVLVSLLTGARRSNVQAMQWSQVNLDAATWTITDTKGGKPQTVTLPPAAVAVLKERKASGERLKERVAGYAALELARSRRETRRRKLDMILSGHSEAWVFPGLGKTGHLVEPKTAWKNLLTRAKLADLRLHDLRRTLGSWQASLGANLAVIQKTLGHAQISTTMIYARLNLDPVRQAVDAAAAAMLTAGGMTPWAEVIPLKK
jgi:integrase